MAFNKAELRAVALAKRHAMPDAARIRFAARLASLGPRLVHDYAPKNDSLVVALYSAIGAEPDLLPLAQGLAAAAVPTALPITGKAGDPLTFRLWSPGDPLVPGRRGIGEPHADAAVVDPDVLFVPLAVFDRRGHRIGYGAGYYDITLAALRRRKSVLAIGVAYAEQEVLFIPAEPHDEPLDLVLTERETLLCKD
ncbi:5-formyltetrahydrofolate cyclo-ligase [Lichenihabitans sp. PAMC28606]|uniref:5-formyltetrahydrofolate cyclo-ligase n=1 Tax=Lichenihabitans sp. PAMC28606 TaxID=2880932 RepID=UPI001D0B6481|nr:5-formyltetrahydrofolate cyclo-ligase [Lichenihabitans sp. PAMC28606]UDL93238.1 5-formyltetrahydrofolate cyclo-ligase [Lichenihabitans sp. PAMC28606]